MTLRLKPKIRRKIKRIKKRNIKTIERFGEGIVNVRPIKTI